MVNLNKLSSQFFTKWVRNVEIKNQTLEGSIFRHKRALNHSVYQTTTITDWQGRHEKDVNSNKKPLQGRISRFRAQSELYNCMNLNKWYELVCSYRFSDSSDYVMSYKWWDNVLKCAGSVSNAVTMVLNLGNSGKGPDVRQNNKKKSEKKTYSKWSERPASSTVRL